MEATTNIEFTTNRIYMVLTRDYVGDGSYDEDIIGVTEDLGLANFLATKEAEHQQEVYKLTLQEQRYSSYNCVRYKLVTDKGFVTKVFVRRVNYFAKKED